MHNQADERRFDCVVTFDANTILDHVIHYNIKYAGRSYLVKRRGTENVQELFSRLSNKPNARIGYFACIRKEAERNVVKALYKQSPPIPMYLLQTKYDECIEKTVVFLNKLHCLDEHCSTDDINCAQAFFEKHSQLLAERGCKAEPADENDCKLLIGTSKQLEEIKGLASGDGCFTKLGDMISEAYAVQVIDTSTLNAVINFASKI